MMNQHTPDTKIGFRHEFIGNQECPYMERWLLQLGKFSLRLHHWIASDDDRHLHDHPWWFITFVLKGGYTDVYDPRFEMGSDRRYKDRLKRGSLRYRPAHHTHTVQVNEGGCWTFLLTGPKIRDWGFWVNGVWKRQRKYFREHGHHPCED
jgi:hypothetical protein